MSGLEFEEELRSSREQREWLELMQDGPHVGFWAFTPDIERFRWTSRVYEIFRIPAGRFEGTKEAFMELIHPDDRASFENVLSRSLVSSANETFDVQHRIILPNGSVKWVMEHMRLYTDETGKTVRVMGLVRDLNDEIALRNELQNLSQRYHAITDAAADAIFILNPEGIIEYVNSAAEKWIGRRFHQIVGKHAGELFDPETAKRQGESVRKVLQTGESVLIEAPNVVEGKTRFLNTRLSPIKDSDNHIIAVLGVSRDVTDRLTAQRRFETIVENIDAVILLLDEKGRTFYASPQVLPVLGYTPDEYVAHDQSIEDPWADFPSDDRARIETEFAKLLQTPEKPFQGSIPFFRRDGSLTTLSYVWVNLLKDPILHGVLVILHDATPLNTAIRNLEEAERIGRFGSYQFDIRNNRWTSSVSMDEIFGIDSDYDRSLEGWVNLIHPDERQEMLLYFQMEVLGKKEPFDHEYRIVRPSDGQVRIVHGLGRLSFDPNGSATHMLGIIQDVTDLRAAQQAEARATELERMNKVMIDRELQMVNLKRRIEELEWQLQQRT